MRIQKKHVGNVVLGSTSSSSATEELKVNMTSLELRHLTSTLHSFRNEAKRRSLLQKSIDTAKTWMNLLISSKIPHEALRTENKTIKNKCFKYISDIWPFTGWITHEGLNMRQESWQTANYCFFWWCRSTFVCPKNSCRIKQAICNAIIKKIDDWGLRGANTGRLNGACALLEAKLWQWCIVFGMPSPHAWDYFWEVFPLVWHLPQLQGSKFWRGLRRSGQMLCTVTSVPGSETILYRLKWILKLIRWWLSCAF